MLLPHLNTPYYQVGNWLIQVHLENGHWNSVLCEYISL